MNNFYSKIMKFLIVFVIVGTSIYIIHMQSNINKLINNPIVQSTELEKGLSIIDFNDISVLAENENGIISQEVKVRVKKESTDIDYNAISKQIKQSYINHYGKESIGTIIVNYLDKKNNLLHSDTL